MRSYNELLRGVRVVELCWMWAGPLAARTLADLGAEVIKVESPWRPDGVRFDTYPDGDPGTEPWHRGGHFQKHSRAKKSLVVDISKPSGHDAFLKLISQADIFVENNTPRVLSNLDISYETLSGVNPRLVMLSMPGFGNSGPYRDWLGYGLNLEAYCGLSTITGYRDTGPTRSAVPYGDPVAGIHGAIVMMAALRHARQTGKGQYIEIAQYESLVNILVEPLFRAAVLGHTDPPDGCHHPFVAPHNVYPAGGEDEWIALVAESDEEFASLAKLVGQPEWLDDLGLTTPYDRKAREDELDAAISAWTSQRTRADALIALNNAGVRAAPVQRVDEVASDPRLSRRGYWTEVDHPVTGRRPYSYLPWRYWNSKPVQPRHAPLFGEHNRGVLEEVVGLSPQDVDRMEREGVISTRPNMA